MIYDNYFKDSLKLNPMYATFVGEYKYNNKLENIYSSKYKQNIKDLTNEYLQKLKKIKNKNLYEKTLEYSLRKEKESNKYPLLLLSFKPHENIVSELIEFTNQGFFPLQNNHDLLQLIERYSYLQNVLKSIEKYFIKMLKKNFSIPSIIVKNLIEEYEEIVDSKTIFKLHRENKFSKDTIQKYNEEIEEKIIPAIKDFLKFLKEYVKKTRTSIGLCDLKKGKDFYRFLVRDYTGLDKISPEEIFSLGKREVKRIKGEMEKIANPHNLKEFIKFLEQPKFYSKSRAELLKKYQEMKKSINKKVLPKYFNFHLANGDDYLIKEVPKYLSKKSPGAYYYMPSIDLKRKGAFFLNTHDLKANADYLIESLCLHEGNPGHNWQLSRAIEKGIPDFITFGGCTAYVEGWALYTEGLGEYKNKYSLYGKLMHEMMRAVRLVVDTGIHYYGWSYQKAYNYMKRNTGLSSRECRNEVMRYIGDPGQAIAYKVGEIYIKKSRDKFLEEKRGDIKDFHEEILDKGAVPLKYLD